MNSIARILLCAVTITCIAFPASAQVGAPPAFDLVTDTLPFQEIGPAHWQMLVDREGSLSLQQVSSGEASGRFGPDSLFHDGIGVNEKVYWMRTVLRNRMQRPADISVALPASGFADRVDYYILRNGKDWVHEVSGILVPRQLKSGMIDDNVIPVELAPGEEVMIYARIFIDKIYYYDVERPTRLDAGGKSTRNLLLTKYPLSGRFFNLVVAWALGIFLFGIMFNIFFFLTVRDKVYLELAWTLFFFALHRCSLLFFAAWPVTEHPAWVTYTGNVWYPLFLFFLIRFVREYFKTRTRTPGWDRIMLWTGIVNICSRVLAIYIGQLLPRQVASKLWTLDMVVNYWVYIALLCTFVYNIKKPTPTTRLLLIASLPLIFSLTISSFLLNGYYMFNAMESRPTPGIINWIDQNGSLINILAMCWFAIFFTLILFLQYKQLQKENEWQTLERERLAREKEQERMQLIAEQKLHLEKEVEERTADLKRTIGALQQTQQQLVHAEKMASLGELTAGIAHEIQNPLNFVNNFADINRELLLEMKEQYAKLKITESSDGIDEDLLNDLEQNMEKISLHGKRADAIVKSMLQHSRSSSGHKEPTDINAICGEYMKLSYHGMRAKDKEFNVELVTDLEDDVGKVEAIPQDLGRVLLNLYNNAFYAVMERKKRGHAGYQPKVGVSTRRMQATHTVEIRVWDNGGGIPDAIREKIFQPFFTTKPTGEGTGLGLSLSFDIISKGHGGKMSIVEGVDEGTVFLIVLPA